jgi:hypothetical protein
MSRQHLVYATSGARTSEIQQNRFVNAGGYPLAANAKYVTFGSMQGRTPVTQAGTYTPKMIRVSSNDRTWSQTSSLCEEATMLDSYSGVFSFTSSPTLSQDIVTIPSPSSEYFTYDFTLPGIDNSSRFYKFHEEKEAFLLMENKLLSDRDFMGKYIAVLHRRIVDSDTNKAVLAKRVYEKYGYVPIFIAQVTKETKRLENSSPEIMPSS